MRQSSLTQHDFTVISNTQVAEGVWRMVFASEVVRSIEPGQFMNFEVPGDGSHILRIPLSFSLADAAHGRVVIYYAVVGDALFEKLQEIIDGQKTDDSLKESREFPFTPEGLDEAVAWIMEKCPKEE